MNARLLLTTVVEGENPKALIKNARTKKRFRCQVCGAPLYCGEWKNFFEYITLNDEGKAAGGLQYGKDRSQGSEILCTKDAKHAVTHLTDDEVEAINEEFSGAT